MKQRTVTAQTLFCLATSALFRIQLPGSCEEHAQIGVTLVKTYRRALSAAVVVFLSTVYKFFRL